jgi:predicted ester cyclase
MVKLNLPVIITVDDYHKFHDMEYNINKVIIDGKVKVFELGFDYNRGQYVGIAYGDRVKPSKDIITEMLKGKKIKLEDY